MMPRLGAALDPEMRCAAQPKVDPQNQQAACTGVAHTREATVTTMFWVTRSTFFSLSTFLDYHLHAVTHKMYLLARHGNATLWGVQSSRAMRAAAYGLGRHGVCTCHVQL